MSPVPIRWHRASIRVWVTVVAATAFLGGVAVTTVGVMTSARSAAIAALDADIHASLARLQPTAREPDPMPPALQQRLAAASESTDLAIRVTEAGRTLATVRGDQWLESLPPDQHTSTVRVGVHLWRCLGAPAGTSRLLTVCAPMSRIQPDLNRRRLLVILPGLAGVAVTALLTWTLTAAATRSIRRLATDARGVADSGEPTMQIPAGPREVHTLAAALNGMLDRLRISAQATEQALETSRRFADDAGHELRTPLTSLGANLSLLAEDLTEKERGQVARAASREHTRLVALVDQLQTLARGQAQDRDLAHVDLADLVDAVVAGAAARHPGHHLDLEAPDTPVMVRGSASGLRSLIENLVENALVHGAGARPEARVAVAVQIDGASVRVVIDDDGPGIPEQDREAALTRFWRGSRDPGADAPPGSGLGLAIALQQARAHGGSLTITDAPTGGARLHLTLPSHIDRP